MPVQFSAEAKQELDAILARYPTRQAACLPALHLAQAEFGHLSDEVVQTVARALELPPAHVQGVATFYTMFRGEKPGKHVLMVCTNVACMLRGAYEILAQVERETGLKPGESNDEFTLVEEECLAACANAPMMVCGREYHLDLTPEKVDAILKELRRRPRQEPVV